jgi:hypothetical protein
MLVSTTFFSLSPPAQAGTWHHWCFFAFHSFYIVVVMLSDLSSVLIMVATLSAIVIPVQG